jgi:hypothetical protein
MDEQECVEEESFGVMAQVQVQVQKVSTPLFRQRALSKIGRR